jgi:hypothetical protein
MRFHVKPTGLGPVLQPERNYRLMPGDGALVPRNSYYLQLIRCGDLAECAAVGAQGLAPAPVQNESAAPPALESAPVDRLADEQKTGARRAPNAKR